jgi:hypothetical protein
VYKATVMKFIIAEVVSSMGIHWYLKNVSDNVTTNLSTINHWERHLRTGKLTLKTSVNPYKTEMILEEVIFHPGSSPQPKHEYGGSP